MKPNIDLDQLADFLVEAKRLTYASDGREVAAERSGFKELEYTDDRFPDLHYRDSYAGFFQAPGQEVVRYQGIPVWAMAYVGGMNVGFRHEDFAKRTFSFLKKALKLVERSKPFRGPSKLSEGEWVYGALNEGDVTDFFGAESIRYEGRVVFSQNYIGGLIIHK